MSSEKDVWEVGEILSCRPVKKSDKPWTILIEAANPANFTEVIDLTKVVDLWWFVLGT